MIENKYGDYTFDYKEFRVYFPLEVVKKESCLVQDEVLETLMLKTIDKALIERLDEIHESFVNNQSVPLNRVPYTACRVDLTSLGCDDGNDGSNDFISTMHLKVDFDNWMYLQISFRSLDQELVPVKGFSDKQLKKIRKAEKAEWKKELYRDIIKHRIKQIKEEAVIRPRFIPPLKQRLDEWIDND